MNDIFKHSGHITEKIIVNGVEYSSIDEVPEPHRTSLKNALDNMKSIGEGGDVNSSTATYTKAVHTTGTNVDLPDGIDLDMVLNKKLPSKTQHTHSKYFDIPHVIFYTVISFATYRLLDWLF